MTNSASYDLDYGYGFAAPDFRAQQADLFDAIDAQSPRPPLIIVMFIALFAFTVVCMGTTSFFRVPYYLGVLSALFAILVYFQYSLPIPTPVMIYVAFVAWSLLTAMAADMGQVIYYALTTIAQIMIMFGIFSTICQDGRSVWIVGVALILGSLVNLGSAVFFGVNVLAGRSAGLASNPNGAALIYGISTCILLPAMVAARSNLARVVLSLVLALFFYGVVSTGSRGGALGFAAPVLYFLWHYRRQIARKPVLLMFLFALVGVGALVLPSQLAETELGKRAGRAVTSLSGKTSEKEGSVRRRLQLKAEAVGVIADHPFLGVGVGNFTPYAFREMGETQSTHDNYLEILVGTGFPGFFLYYSIFAWLWFIAGKLQKSPFITDPEAAILSMTRMFVVFRATWDVFDNTGWSFKPNWITIAVLAGFLTGLRTKIQQRGALSAAYGLT